MLLFKLDSNIFLSFRVVDYKNQRIFKSRTRIGKQIGTFVDSFLKQTKSSKKHALNPSATSFIYTCLPLSLSLSPSLSVHQLRSFKALPRSIINTQHHKHTTKTKPLPNNFPPIINRTDSKHTDTTPD